MTAVNAKILPPVLDRAGICRHEAAHAVMAYASGLVVAPVGVLVDGVDEAGALGVAYVGAYHGGAPSLRSLAGVLAAGSLYQAVGHAYPATDADLADRIHRARSIPHGEITRESVLSVPRGDHERIFALFLIEWPGASDAQLVGTYRDVEASTLAVLRRPDVGRSIEAVAAALHDRGRLAPETVAALIEPSALVIAPEFARTIADLFADGRPVFLAFSGGKESIVLADFCEPWRDRVTLLWVNTGFFAPEMVAFVRGYAERGWDLVEVRPRDMMQNWDAAGIPADVIPVPHTIGWAEPRMQPWTQCCFTNRQMPLNDYLAQQGPCVLIHGQRREDRGPTAATMKGFLAPEIDVAMPLWEWSTRAIFERIAERGLRLPEHYEAFPESLECLCCPAAVTAERLAYLDAHRPEAAAFVRPTMKRMLDAADATIADLRGRLAAGDHAAR